VHRIISALLNGEIDERKIEKFEKFATASADASSENELRATYAERDIDDLYKCVYMADRIGQVLDCVICSVNNFGFFARTQNLCEGLVPIASLGAPFYFDEASLTLSSGRRTFALGQRVKIKVVDSDVVTRRVTFALVSCDEADSTPSVPFNRPATVKKSSKSSHAHHSSKPKHKKSAHSRKSHSHKGRGKR
jgi:ribonuclease R